MSKVAVNFFSEALTDFNEVKLVEEAVGNDGEKEFFIEGIFAQSEKENRNRRIYPKDVLFPDVERYIEERVKRRVAWGELDHPDERIQVNAKEASHLVTDLWFEGNDVMGRAKIIDSPNGNIIKGMMKAGGQICVSTRGLGRADKNRDGVEVMNAFHMTAIDVVSFPSGIDCFVDGKHESLEILVESGQLTKSQAYKIMKEDNTKLDLVAFNRFVKLALKGL